MIDGRRILALIPARGGSKGLIGKNIIDLCGRPLLAWTMDAVRGSRFIDNCVISSDDDAILEVAKRIGIEVPFKRPSELARDDSPTIDVVLHALDVLHGYQVLVLLQPTSPLRIAEDIDGALEAMIAAQSSSVVGVRPAQDHPVWTFRADGPDGLLVPFVEDPDLRGISRRQDLPRAWCPNGALYAADVLWLRRHGRLIGPGSLAYPMPPERSVDIDTATDLAIAEKILSTRQIINASR